MEDVKSILVASERLFGSDPSETMKQTRVVAEVCEFFAALFEIIVICFNLLLFAVSFLMAE